MILSIETSIKNGSLALLCENGEIDEWCGNGEVSRSVDLIVQIREILERNGVSRHELQKILVSKGPGSFTGLRVGISAAMGLSLALDCAVGGISILRAMAELHRNKQKVLSVVSAGRGLFFWQTFDFANDSEVSQAEGSSISEILTGNLDTLLNSQLGKDVSHIIIQFEAFEDLRNSDAGDVFLQKNTYTILGENLATHICRLYESNPALFDCNIEPLYVRAAVISGK